eukprot:m.281599 g.281599  ORF g.281599 m.281599 type:complete len:484 (+) comp16173_c0_seq2:238-1689(+)
MTDVYMLGSVNDDPGRTLRRPLLSAEDEGIYIEADRDGSPVTQHSKGKPTKTSFSETLVNFIKGNLGSGFWCLNNALGRSGYVVGLIGLPVLGLIAWYCMQLLLQCKQRLRLANAGKPLTEALTHEQMDKVSYEDVAEMALGKYAKRGIQFCLIVTQFGFCCVCLLFIAEHTHDLMPKSYGFSVGDYVWMLVPLVALLCFIKDFKYIAPTSAMANVLILYGVAVTIYFFVTKWDQTDHRCQFYPGLNKTKHHMCTAEEVDPVMIGDSSGLPIFFGMAMYCFQSIGLVLPMEVQMKNPRQAPLIFSIGMTTVTVMFMCFGAVGYYVVGYNSEAEATSISEFLPSGALYDSVKIAINLVLLQTYALQYFPGIQIVESLIDFQGRWGIRGVKLMISRNTLRVGVCCLTAIIAIEVPHLALVISLVGALGCGALALIVPPVLHLVLHPNAPRWRQALHCLITIAGIVAASIAFYTSLVAVMHASSSS